MKNKFNPDWKIKYAFEWVGNPWFNINITKAWFSILLFGLYFIWFRKK
jgi:hypothetical protein